MSQGNLKPNVDVTEVEAEGGQILKISSKWGIGSDGRLAKPSEGGFGVVTENGRRIGMWDAQRYFKEEGDSNG
ncbi:MAG: hypothetical protein HZC02_05380 [Candidatus Levybacteria bacterium]|nr:hypothetical protein [Candidatus Levybacteria bacterium]